ncbi:MAG: hypothetical protein LBV16_01460 [Elusimicrobiota bacterium]|jgi:hypothetical protein|nr:hypothetical protein [Elusimicrobiota bacterium]
MNRLNKKFAVLALFLAAAFAFQTPVVSARCGYNTGNVAGQYPQQCYTYAAAQAQYQYPQQSSVVGAHCGYNMGNVAGYQYSQYPQQSAVVSAAPAACH